MQTSSLLLTLLTLSLAAYVLGRARSIAVAAPGGGIRTLHSLPSYYGYLSALWCGVPALILVALWLSFQETVITNLVVAELPEQLRALSKPELDLVVNDLRNIVDGNVASRAVDANMLAAAEHYRYLQSMSRGLLSALVVVMAIGSVALAWRAIHPALRARNRVETLVLGFLLLCAMVAIFTTVGIVFSVLFESARFFRMVPISDFLFGLQWSPQIAIRADQVGASGAFGVLPLLAGTLLISAIAMSVAVPIGLLSAIYLSEYASRRLRAVAKPALEILAGVPTVVYGFFAALTVAPALRGFGASLGLDVASESALAAGAVMGIMIIPFVSSLSDDVINAVPQSMRDGSYALGATQSETVRRVLIPAALPGIVGGILLAVSRAIGETMIVVMAAGLSANLTANPLEAVTTVTVQIVTLLVGDQEFDSPKTLAAFALGLMLFLITLILNIIALHVVRKYREQYE
jgi:phosphate transport system permease protein